MRNYGLQAGNGGDRVSSEFLLPNSLLPTSHLLLPSFLKFTGMIFGLLLG